MKWGKENTELTIKADNSYDKLFLSIIEKQVCDRGVYVNAIEGRLSESQKKNARKVHGSSKSSSNIKKQFFKRQDMQVPWIRRLELVT